MKKITYVLLLLVALFMVTSCGKKEVEVTDAQTFKEEYESLNGESNDSGKLYREITIDENNPFVYATADEIAEKIDNKETFAVYFGFKSCPWCRSILPTLIEVAKDLNINKIYYVDVYDIRDTFTYDKDKKEPVRTKEGTEGYYKLIDKLSNVLEDYTVNNTKDKPVSTNEKRIYAPNIVSIVEGEPSKLTTGISEKQTDGYMELTEEMLKETYEDIECVLKCLNEEKKVCTQGC